MAIGYHTGLDATAILDKQNTTSETETEEQKIEANIKTRKRYQTFMLLSGVDNLR